MYIILAYDVGEERVNRARKLVRRYLPRVQNSVFEGDISESKLDKLKSQLESVLELDRDSVLIWVLRDAKWVDRQTLGCEKLPVDNML